MAKMAVLKPIMWNAEGYKRPAGCPSTSGYSHDKGFGHEEWNNNPRWFWQGWKVFHTEGGDKLLKAARHGDLGMVMVASHAGTAYALGVATNVFANDPDEMKRIVSAVGKDEDLDAVWQLPTVQKQFKTRDDFLKHWREEPPWIRWRCLPDHYYWFAKPIRLNPERVTGKKRLAMHHGRLTETTPAVLLGIIDAYLPKDRTAIREWLSSGDFTELAESKTPSQISGSKILKRIQRGSNAPSDCPFEYRVEGSRNVEPLHDRLQKLFVNHLKAEGIRPQENVDYLDVEYTAAGETTFCEIKPTDNMEPRYAIRAAIGQLLEYRYTKQDPAAALEIVIGSRPRANDVGFVKSLSIRLTYYDTATGEFVSV